jgi:hypothetical protein
MGDDGVLVVQVQRASDDDDDEVAELTQRLRAQLLELDVDSVDHATDTSAQEGAKGFETFIGRLAVHLGKEALRTVIASVVNWATNAHHSVKIIIDGNTLEVSGPTSAQQEKMINEYFDQLEHRT